MTTTQPKPTLATNSGTGWYEVIHPEAATTCIVYVHEDGSIYFPEGEQVLSREDFTFAAATGRAHRLVRADDIAAHDAQVRDRRYDCCSHCAEDSLHDESLVNNHEVPCDRCGDYAHGLADGRAQHVSPSVEDIERSVRADALRHRQVSPADNDPATPWTCICNQWHGGDFIAHVQHMAALDILALLSSQPTVEQVRRETLEEAIRRVQDVYDLQCPVSSERKYVPGARMAHRWWEKVLGGALDDLRRRAHVAEVHDDLCEAEYIVPAGGWTDCDCARRARAAEAGEPR